MSKGKKIYFLVLLLITILVTTFYFSYAIFSNTKEEHGKLNIVAGTLNYKIESSELDSDSITLEANTSKEIKIKLTSLNEVSSKYELYYILDKTNDKVSVGYSKDTKDNVLGTIEGSSSKVISIVVRNDSDTSSKVTFKVLGGLLNNELALKDGNSLNQELALCNYEKGYVWNFDYTGGEQEFTTPCTGTYKLETWGAQGGNSINNYFGGYGAYATGKLNIRKDSIVYINIGGKGENSSSSGAAVTTKGGYNGGGDGKNHISGSGRYVSAGGGATHMSYEKGLLSTLSSKKESILIVSSGGSGTGYYSDTYYVITPGHGGGFKGTTGATYFSGQIKTNFGIPSQTDGYSFGKGEDGKNEGAGAGSGYYGGYTSGSLNGSGGSSYIGNQILTDKSMYCYNCKESSEESTKTISTTCTSETPTENCSKQGNGYARITYLGN